LCIGVAAEVIYSLLFLSLARYQALLLVVPLFMGFHHDLGPILHKRRINLKQRGMKPAGLQRIKGLRKLLACSRFELACF